MGGTGKLGVAVMGEWAQLGVARVMADEAWGMRGRGRMIRGEPRSVEGGPHNSLNTYLSQYIANV